jgi:hypothetical protein
VDVVARRNYWFDSENTQRITYSLRDATNVGLLINRFNAVGGWTLREALQVETIQPGDYLALRGGQHSAVIVAISNDYRYIWTSEGNVGDCVRFMRRDLLVDGALNPEIDGIGNLTTLFTEHGA